MNLIMAVSIIEDNEKLSALLEEIISAHPRLTVVGRFGSAEVFFQSPPEIAPDVILLDIGLPVMSGIEAIPLIKTRYPEAEILMLTVYDDEEKIFQSIQQGATGYLLKNSQPDLLLSAIEGCRQGAPMTPSIARKVLRFLRVEKPSDHAGGFDELTERENEILDALVDGLSYKKIADKFFISSLTVHSHIKSIYRKLQVHSKSEAVSKVLKNRPL